MTWIKPEDVISPKSRWRIVDVLLSRGKGGWSLALGIWDDRPRLAIRWNGDEDTPIGTPQSRGLPVWTMLPEELHDPVLKVVQGEDSDKARVARALLK